jgi:hypothetical protein
VPGTHSRYIDLDAFLHFFLEYSAYGTRKKIYISISISTGKRFIEGENEN